MTESPEGSSGNLPVVRGPALAALAIGLACLMVAPFMASVNGMGTVLAVAGAGCCVFGMMMLAFKKLQRELDPYDLKKLREIDEEISLAAIEVPKVLDGDEPDNIICPKCMQVYDARLPICPFCSRLIR